MALAGLILASSLVGGAVPGDGAPDRVLVGAIRWDAWHGPASEVGLTAEKTLAPARWHYRLPFYGKILGEYAVEARGNTQAIMDQEIAYAHAAGLDYWAFVIYPEEHALSLGIQHYLSSTRKTLVNFCLNLQGGWEAGGGPNAWPEKVRRYVSYFKEPSYQTVLRGRPLVYLYSVEGLVGPGRFETWEAARAAFGDLRTAAEAAGAGDPYIVAQGWSPEALKEQAQMLELDAIGAYASTAGAKAGSFASLAEHTERWWESFKATGCEVVPLASAGWDMRPRVETPVPWVKNGDIEQFYEAPTPEELEAHLKKAIAWTKANPDVARARAVLIYAWNEFDEGGWICPTLREGTARLDALGRVLGTPSPPREDTEPVGAAIPVTLGVDTAGSYHATFAGQHPWENEAFFEALRTLGATHVNLHLDPVTHAGEPNSPETAARIQAMDDAIRAHGMTYTLSLEYPNFAPNAEITPGVNEFEQTGGRHFWLLRMDWLRPVLAPRQQTPLLQAVIYDEPAQMQLSNNKYSNFPRDDFDKPFFVNTHGLPMEEAYNRLVAECTRIRAEHYGGAVPLNTEQVWPDLFHIFARAGWTVAPKLLKEHMNAVVASIALSAAVQYQDAGGGFWASPDLWGVLGYPGHPPESLRSALLMAYWLGAEQIYVENVDYMGLPKGGVVAGPASRHPEAGERGSLLAWDDPDTFSLTRYGEVYRDFAKRYVPAHPRTVDWRTYRPKVAIVRLPDGGWGQFDAGDRPVPHGEASSRNRLLGNREMPLDAAASEWLLVWPILTHGVVKAGAISYNNPMVYPEMMDFFIPIDSVGVFDHRVQGNVLDSVECFIVCGHTLSEATFNDIRQRVADGGATCIISRRLFALHSAVGLPGDWLVTDDFTDPEVAATLQPFLGPPDVACFRFADQTIEFRRGDRPNSIDVRVLPGAGDGM